MEKVTHPSREWTDEEIKERLKNYVEVPREYWENIRYGNHIRYFTKKGEFRVGGFILKNPVVSESWGEIPSTQHMKLQNGFNPRALGYFSWIASYDDIDKIFIKPDAISLMVLSSLETATRALNENIKKLSKKQKKIEQEQSRTKK